MNERAYKAMTFAGVVNITIGIVMLVVGIATGTIAIISGTKLMKGKKGLIF